MVIIIYILTETETKMKIDFKKVVNKATATGLVAIILLFVGYEMYQTNIELKIQAAQRAIELQEAQDKAAKELAEANRVSDIEVLEAEARKASEASKAFMKQIEDAKALIKSKESKYEIELLRSKCYTNQIERKIDGLEYNKNYCETDSNLEQFRTVK